MPQRPRRIAFTTRFLFLTLIIPLAACSKAEKPSARVFASPDEAGSSLLAAAKSGDQNALIAIFRPGFERAYFIRRCRARQERGQCIRGRL
jgi:hypothetical protein